MTAILFASARSARSRCGGVLTLLACAVLAVSAEVSSSLDSVSKDSLLTSNHQLLSGLGLARLQGAQGQAAPAVPATDDDSRVFVVRLPPSQHYYSLLKAPPAVANSVSKQVEVGFRSNGKPARVYHWNIPVLKKMAAARRRSTQGSSGDRGDRPGQPAKATKKPSKSKLNATRRKVAAYHRVQQQQHLLQYQQQQKQKLKQQMVEAQAEPAGPSPYFYAPANKKTSMHKLLGGNGKPHTMYVLEKSRAPAYYQRLLP